MTKRWKAISLKAILLAGLWFIGWAPLTWGMSGNFSTSFDGMEGLSIIGGESKWTVPYYYNFPWPEENAKKNKAYFFPSNESGGIRMTQDMNRYDAQEASVDFLAPDGISDHIDIGIQGYFVANTCISGYFAILGFDRRLCKNPPNRPCSQLHLGVEKATCATNWLYGGKPATINPNKVYRIQIRTDRYNNRTRITAKLYRYDSAGWVLIENTCYDDYLGDDDGGPLKGGVAWFGPIMQNGRMYFDHFKVNWN